MPPTSPINAIIVSVDYADFLSLSLQYNHHHFERILVISAIHDRDTHQAVANFGREHSGKVGLMITDAFYEGGAMFNKYKAVEQGLDLIGRQGWLCVMDADVFIPKTVSITSSRVNSNKLLISNSNLIGTCTVQVGQLFTPLRRMCTITTNNDPNNPSRINPNYDPNCNDPTNPLSILPSENTWKQYPIHPNQGEWAGYMHLFHAADPVLEKLPWYETDWKHAGGADSMFQKKWNPTNKVRPEYWEVLHLGNAGMNWCGRSTPTLDGKTFEQKEQRLEALRNMIRLRRNSRSFRHEKL